MMVTRRSWVEIPYGSLVIGPSGRVWRLESRYTDPHGHARAHLVDPENIELNAYPAVDPGGTIEVIESAPDAERAIDTLSRSFNLVRM